MPGHQGKYSFKEIAVVHQENRCVYGSPRICRALQAAGVIRRVRDGVRLLANGEIKSSVAFEIAGASKAATAAVEKAGGSVSIAGAGRQSAE